MSVFLSYIYLILSGLISVDFINKKIIFTITSIVLLSGPATDLAMSMVVVRAQRNDVSALDLAIETIKTYQDKETLRIAKILSVENKSDWDETYVDNLFFSRLSNLKFTDNSLTLAGSLDSSQVERMRIIEWQRVVSLLPLELITLFKIDTDKVFFTSGSGGDFLYATATNDNSVIGGFRTGSILGSGYALFGWLYPLIFGFVGIIVFSLVDAQAEIIFNESNNEKVSITPVINSLAIATLFSWFFYLTSAATGVESMSELAGYLFRGWIQNLMIYSIAYWSTYGFIRLLTSR